MTYSPKGFPMLNRFLSKDEEPLRRYVYGVGVVILALLVTLGVITDDLSKAIDAILVAALLIPGVEVARSKVSPAVEVPASEQVEPEPVEEPVADEAPVEDVAADEPVDAEILDDGTYEPRHSTEA